MALRVVVAVCVLLGFSGFSHSSPWIGTTDPQLHYDLQMLVDYGYLDQAATTFPVPWRGVANALFELDTSEMPAAALVAANRLTHYARLYRNGTPVVSATAYGSNERSRFASFDGQQGEKARLNLSSDFAVGRLAGKLSFNTLPGGKTNFDQSYLAYQLGDWNIRAGAIDQWWGPGHSTSLVLSTNGRPIKAVSISRSTADRSDNSLLAYLGPWFWTAQIGQLEQDVSVENAKIWSARLTLKPLKALELGLSWVATWGGRSGVTDSLGDFFDVITLQKRCLDGSSNCENKDYAGSHLSGIDAKYTTVALGRPLSVYGQFVYEGKSSEFNVNNKLYLWGVSTLFWGSKVYFESSDTNIACVGTEVSVDSCFYENGTYSSAYRFYNQTIGGEYDSQARMWALGLLKHFSDGDVMEFAVRRIKLNDNVIEMDSNQILLTEKITQLSAYYQTVWQNWQVKLGAVIDHSQSHQQSTDTNYNLFAEVKYSF